VPILSLLTTIYVMINANFAVGNALNRGPLAHVTHDSLRFNNWNLSLNYEIMVGRSSTRGQVATQEQEFLRWYERERERERERFVSRSHGNKGLDAISSWAARGHILRSLLRLLLVRLGDAWGCIHFGSLQTIHIHYKMKCQRNLSLSRTNATKLLHFSV